MRVRSSSSSGGSGGAARRTRAAIARGLRLQPRERAAGAAPAGPESPEINESRESPESRGCHRHRQRQQQRRHATRGRVEARVAAAAVMSAYTSASPHKPTDSPPPPPPVLLLRLAARGRETQQQQQQEEEQQEEEEPSGEGCRGVGAVRVEGGGVKRLGDHETGRDAGALLLLLDGKGTEGAEGKTPRPSPNICAPRPVPPRGAAAAAVTFISVKASGAEIKLAQREERGSQCPAHTNPHPAHTAGAAHAARTRRRRSGAGANDAE
ncbi:unnamed protein product [Lampetra fluviatilis]